MDKINYKHIFQFFIVFFLSLFLVYSISFTPENLELNLTSSNNNFIVGDNFSIKLSNLNLSWSNYSYANITYNSTILNLITSQFINFSENPYNDTYKEIMWNFTTIQNGSDLVLIQLVNNSDILFNASIEINISNLDIINLSKINISHPIDIEIQQTFSINLSYADLDWTGFRNLTLIYDDTSIINLSQTFINFSNYLINENFEFNFTSLINKNTSINFIFEDIYGIKKNKSIDFIIFNNTCPQVHFASDISDTLLENTLFDDFDNVYLFANSSYYHNGTNTFYYWYRYSDGGLNLTSLGVYDVFNPFTLLSNYTGLGLVNNKEYGKQYDITARIIDYQGYVCHHTETVNLIDVYNYINISLIYNNSLEICENLIGINFTDTNSSDGNFPNLHNITITDYDSLNPISSNFQQTNNSNNYIFFNLTCSDIRSYNLNFSYDLSKRVEFLDLYYLTKENVNFSIGNDYSNFSDLSNYINFLGNQQSWKGIDIYYYAETRNGVKHTSFVTLLESINDFEFNYNVFNNETKEYNYTLFYEFVNNNGISFTFNKTILKNEFEDPNITITWVNPISSIYQNTINNYIFNITNHQNINTNVSTYLTIGSNTQNYNFEFNETTSSFIFSKNLNFDYVENIEISTSSSYITNTSGGYIFNGDYWLTELNESFQIITDGSSSSSSSDSGGTSGSIYSDTYEDDNDNNVEDSKDLITIENDEIDNYEEELTLENDQDSKDKIFDNDKSSSKVESEIKKVNEFTSRGIRTTSSFEIKDKKTIIKTKLKNGNILKQYDVFVNVVIPKEVIENTDYIKGDFKIIKYDPEIQFHFNEIGIGEELVLNYTIDKILTQGDIDSIITKINSSFNNEEISNLEINVEKTGEVVEIKIDVLKLPNATKVNAILDVDGVSLDDAVIYLNIPKCFAEHIDEIEFERDDYEVIEDDPLVAWSFDKLDSRENLNFKVLSEIDEECWKNISVLPIAKNIEEKFTKQASWYAKVIPFSVLILILILTPFVSKYSKIRKLGIHDGKHFIHKDILRDVGFGFSEIFLVLIIILNLMEFFGFFFTPTVDFIKKIISWSFLGVLVYNAGLSKLFFGFENKKHDLLLILGYFGLMFSNIEDALFWIFNNSTSSDFIWGVLNWLYSFENLMNNLVYNSFYIGLLILIGLSIWFLKKEISTDSVMAVLHGDGVVDRWYKIIERFVILLVLYFGFFIIFFKFFMEWLAVAVDAAIIVFAIFIYLSKFVMNHNKHYDEDSVVNKIGNAGQSFYIEFLNLFKSKSKFFFGLVGMLVLHLVVDFSNYILPYLISFNDSLYFSRLSVGDILINHTPLISLIGQFIGEVSLSTIIQVTIIYLLNFIAIIFCLLIPVIMWYDLYKGKRMIAHPILNALFFTSLITFIFVPLFDISAILNNVVVGVDVSLLNIFESNVIFSDILILSAITFLVVLIMSFSPIANHMFLVFSIILSQMFFLFYIISYVYSWYSFFTNAISIYFSEGNFIIAITFLIFFAFILLFYIIGFIANLYLIFINYWVKTSYALRRVARPVLCNFNFPVEAEIVKDKSEMSEDLEFHGWNSKLTNKYK